MKIVLDTNVLVAGLLQPFGPCGEMARMVSSGELILLYDARIQSEYHEVLRRPKFSFDEDDVAALLDQIEFRGHVVASSPLAGSLPDPDDVPFLEVAFWGNAEYLVTGNQSDFPPERCQGVPVVSPREFLKAYIERGPE